MVVLELELELEPDLLSTRSGSRALVLLGGGMLGVYSASWLHIGRGLLPDCSGVGGEVAARLAPTCAVGVGVSVGGVMRRARTLVGVAAVVVMAAAAPPPDGGVSSLLPLLLLDRKSGLATHLADSTSSSICDSVRYQSVWEGQPASQSQRTQLQRRSLLDGLQHSLGCLQLLLRRSSVRLSLVFVNVWRLLDADGEELLGRRRCHGHDGFESSIVQRCTEWWRFRCEQLIGIRTNGIDTTYFEREIASCLGSASMAATRAPRQSSSDPRIVLHSRSLTQSVSLSHWLTQAIIPNKSSSSCHFK